MMFTGFNYPERRSIWGACVVLLALTPLAHAVPEIAIRGTNGVVIVDGTTAVTNHNGLDFGAAYVAGGFVERAFAITNSGDTVLTVTGAVITGAGTSDFSVVAFPASVAAGTASNLIVRFDPATGGARTTGVSVANNDANEASYDFVVRGMGLASAFRVTPYLQHPASNAMTVSWLAETAEAGELRYGLPGGATNAIVSAGLLATNLGYHSSENGKFPGSIPPAQPYLHQERLTNLLAATTYWYAVQQGDAFYTNALRTPAAADGSVRFVMYADSETEPESTGVRVNWDNPAGGGARQYLIDQTIGYASNLAAMKARAPDFVMIAGDLTESGGEQRDWDEFWRHNAGALNDIAGAVPIIAAPGNHEYYAGPSGGGYGQPGSENAVSKFQTYFDNPTNDAGTVAQQERYYRLDYGPVTLIMLDTCNGNDSVATQDTSRLLSTSTGCRAPDFNPGTPMHQWLQRELADAQTRTKFTFVAFHHCPYSVGPHGLATEQQSGVPVRVLTPLFLRYGVDAVLCGHDEMVERSVVNGNELRPDGGTNAYGLHVYDYGVGGDGLRGPEAIANPYQAFLVHDDAPEVWSNGVLVAGGKHYGHLEVNVATNAAGAWTATLTPVYMFPNMTAGGALINLDRRVYNDVVTLVAPAAISTSSTTTSSTSSSSTSTTTTTSTTTSADPNGDQDGDGLPDEWELRHGFDASTSNAPDANADGDAHTDWEEYVADTEPTNAGSQFRAAAIVGQGPLFLGLADSSTGRLYDVYWASNLLAEWAALGLDRPGTGSNLTFVLTNAAPTGFYQPAVKVP